MAEVQAKDKAEVWGHQLVPTEAAGAEIRNARDCDAGTSCQAVCSWFVSVDLELHHWLPETTSDSLAYNPNTPCWPSALDLWPSGLVLFSLIAKWNLCIIQHLFCCLGLRIKTNRQRNINAKTLLRPQGSRYTIHCRWVQIWPFLLEKTRPCPVKLCTYSPSCPEFLLLVFYSEDPCPVTVKYWHVFQILHEQKSWKQLWMRSLTVALCAVLQCWRQPLSAHTED